MKTKMDSFSLTSKEGITYMRCQTSEAKDSLFNRPVSMEKLLTLRILPFQKIEEPVNINVKVRCQNNVFFC